MGLTIYYAGGRANSRKEIDELFDYLCRIASKQGWDYEIKTRLFKGNITGYVLDSKNGECREKSIAKDRTVFYKVFYANIDEGCETFRIGFDYESLDCAQFYQLSDMDRKIQKGGFFCKTQYSQHFLDTHHAICIILDYIKSHHVAGLEVVDEGGYYGNWDKEALEIEYEKWSDLMDCFGDGLEGAVEELNKGRKVKDTISFKRAAKIQEK